MGALSAGSKAAILGCIFLQLAMFSSSERVFGVHRLLQYDKAKTPLGSRRGSINLPATVDPNADLSKRVLIIQHEDVTDELITRMTSQTQRLGGVVVVLPEDMTSVGHDEIERWKGFEARLLNAEINYAIYFAFGNDQLRELQRELGHSSDGYHIQTQGAEPTKIASVAAFNIQGWLAGSSSTLAPGAVLPTIAIVAHHDSYGAAPGLANGADSNGSGVVALLEIARVFSKLYDGSRTQGSHNLLFVLTGAGKLNFAGTKQWLQNTDMRLLESVEFALCLDTIGSGSEALYLHVSKPRKEPVVDALYTLVEDTAKQMDIPLSIVQKKINISNDVVAWEHEQFSRKRILAATLSSRPSSAHVSSGLFDARSRVSTPILRRNIGLVIELLAKHIYGHRQLALKLSEGELGANLHFAESWLEAIGNSTRMAPYTQKKAALVDGFQQVLKSYTSEVSLQQHTIDDETIFYSNEEVTMSAFKVKPALFDVILSAVIAAYLALLVVVIQGPANALLTVKDIFGIRAASKRRPTGKA